jgi:transcriptional regulator GlxA family with amidase domain
MEKRIQIVILIVEEELSRTLKLADLARVVNLSTSRLQHIFKVETGRTITQYQQLLRMEAARDLLDTTFLSVKQIMLRVGATDRSHFERNFKRYYGATPCRYRADTQSVAPAIYLRKADSRIRRKLALAAIRSSLHW